MLDAFCSGRPDKTSESPFLAYCFPHHHPPTQEDSFSRLFFFSPQIQTNHSSSHPNHLLYPAFVLRATIRLPSPPHCQGPEHSGRISAPDPGGTSGKEPACQCGDSRDRGLISGLGGGNGNPLQYSCLENLMDRGAYSPRSGKESETTEAT